jgi:hypothetical protein
VLGTSLPVAHAGSNAPPADGAEGDVPYDEMKIAQATIYNELIQLCSGEGYSIVSNYECGQQAWEALQTHYAPATEAAVINIYERLTLTRLERNENASALVGLRNSIVEDDIRRRRHAILRSTESTEPSPAVALLTSRHANAVANETA